jgi:glycosyltransferase involved in cell wall biosynthesis
MIGDLIFFVDSPGYAGSELNLLKLLEMLSGRVKTVFVDKNIDKRFHDILLSKDLNVRFKPNGNRVYNFFSIVLFYFRNFNELKSSKLIFWCHHIDSSRWTIFLSAFFRNHFIIIEQFLVGNYKEAFKKSRLSLPLKKYATKMANLTVICAFSHYDNYFKTFCPQNLTVIPNTRDINQIKKIKSDSTLVKVSNKFKVCSIGRLEPVKDHLTLIRAVNLSKFKSNIELIIVGEGTMKKELEIVANACNIQVNFMGYVSDPISTLVKCDLFVFPSRDEGLPGALIEAMAANIPCIASDIPGNSELVIHNQTGLLFPTGDSPKLSFAIDSILSDPSLAESYANKAFNHVLSNYDIGLDEHNWKQLISILY